jgi:hypothetical protein
MRVEEAEERSIPDPVVWWYAVRCHLSIPWGFDREFELPVVITALPFRAQGGQPPPSAQGSQAPPSTEEKVKAEPILPWQRFVQVCAAA